LGLEEVKGKSERRKLGKEEGMELNERMEREEKRRRRRRGRMDISVFALFSRGKKKGRIYLVVYEEVMIALIFF